ncbi:retinoic acid receptor responder 3-like [Garra rufa]|uniref:retinoic acid receptor responder 3-like n=1 Tax=Garra rufa TaxID=137080 RepID=UPI003CCE5FCE
MTLRASSNDLSQRRMTLNADWSRSAVTSAGLVYDVIFASGTNKRSVAQGEIYQNLIRVKTRIVFVAMAPKYDQKPQLGDLIEIFRGTYQHWAIYVGESYVIHLAPPSEHAQAGAYSMMSVLCDKARVKKEELYEVVGNDEYRINNLLDEKYEPHPVQEILRDAHRLLGQELPYCVFSGNCEHFVTEMRYGKPQSRQVRKAVEVGVGVVGVAALTVGVLAAVSALFGSKENHKRKQ